MNTTKDYGVCDFCGADHVEVYSEVSPKICLTCAEKALTHLSDARRAVLEGKLAEETAKANAPSKRSVELGAIAGWYVPKFAEHPDAARVFWPNSYGRLGLPMAVVQSHTPSSRPWKLTVDGRTVGSYGRAETAMLAGVRLMESD